MNSVIHYGGITENPLYNCSAHSPEEWSIRDGTVRTTAGVLSIIYGIIVEIIYFPCLYVIFTRDHIKMSCFKIMFVLGITDMAAIVVNSIITGILLLEGSVFCTHPIVNFIAGSMGLGLWCSACIVCLLLVTNRLMDITAPHLVKTIFGGTKTYFILILPFVYGLYFIIFTPPVVFSSKYGAWFFDPFIYPDRGLEYQNIPHSFNNIFIVFFTCILYTFFCFCIGHKYRSEYSMGKNKAHAQIFFQSSVICAINFFASIIYVIMQFIPVPHYLIIMGHVGWQLGHGCPAFIYLGMNKTIRTGVLKLFNLQVVPAVSSAISNAMLTNTSGKTDNSTHY